MVSENTILYVRFRHAHDMHRSYIPLYTFLTKEMPYFTYFSHTEAVYFRSVKPCRSKYTGLLIAFTASCKGNQCWLYMCDWVKLYMCMHWLRPACRVLSSYLVVLPPKIIHQAHTNLHTTITLCKFRARHTLSRAQNWPITCVGLGKIL